MKKIGFILPLVLFLFIILLLSNTQSSISMPLVPYGANWRLYPYQGSPGQTGNWVKMSEHYDKLGNPTWGENQCRPPGGECHSWDWVTWWFSLVAPEPPAPSGNYGPPLQFDCDSVVYDPVSGKYFCP